MLSIILLIYSNTHPKEFQFGMCKALLSIAVSSYNYWCWSVQEFQWYRLGMKIKWSVNSSSIWRKYNILLHFSVF